ncbi:MAG: radical SAM protein, partial [Deltaproteobacteria bacterium]|nr:radical SAM protein [Deltaproteobacteria bacterium]
HPKDVSERLIEAFGYLPRLCNHIHLPVQSGSDRILALMNRKYTREHYLNIVRRLREVRSDIAITTDFIVGFPTETDEDFDYTMSLLSEVKFDTAFSFMYSPRPLTKAFREMPDDVPSMVKEERLRCLQEKIEEIAQEKNRELSGRCLEVLVEGKSDKFKGQYVSRTSCNRVVNILSDFDITGELVRVRITEPLKHSLKGELLKGERDEKGRCGRNTS